MKQKLLQALNNIFTSAGYNVTESYRCDFVAEKNGQKTFIKLETCIDEHKLKRFANMIKGNRGIFIITDTVESHFYKIAADIEIDLWNYDDLSIRIGRAILADMEGTIDKLDLIEPIKQVVPDKFKILSEESQKHPSVNKGNLFDMLLLRNSRNCSVSSKWNMLRPLRGRNTPLSLKYDMLKSTELIKEKPIEKPIEESPIPNVLPNILTLNTLPIKISIDDATTVAKSYVGHVKNITLKFVPFWDYNYSVNYTRNYKSKIIDVKGENFGNINALNGQETEIYFTDLKNQVVVPIENYEIKIPIILKSEIENRLIEIITKKYTKTIEFNESTKRAIVTESKTFKPEDGEIVLNYDLKYIPVWEIEGSKSIIEINGYDAEILKNTP